MSPAYGYGPQAKSASRLLVLLVSVLSVWGSANPAGAAPATLKQVLKPGDTVAFPAELGTTESILGKGFGLDLTETDSRGLVRTVYPPSVETVMVNQYESYFTQVDNKFLLDANARWLFSKASVRQSNDSRYMVIRVSQIDRVVKLQTAAEPQERAPMYASKIFYGWSVYFVLSGESNKFTSDVAADIKAAGANFKTLTQSNSIDVGIHLIGLRPKEHGDVVMATSLSDIKAYFETDGEAQPIFVEYTIMEGAEVDPIPWNSFTMKPGTYRVTLSVEAQPSKSDGRPWDAGGDPPDVMVKVNCGGQERTLFEVKNQFKLEQSFDATLTRASELRAMVVDKDLLENDPIGEIQSFKFTQLKKIGVEIPLRTSGQVKRASMTVTCQSCD